MVGMQSIIVAQVAKFMLHKLQNINVATYY